MASTSMMDPLILPHGVKIPRIGFGVWASRADQCVDSCLAALKGGYRHIDTGDCYGNEEEVGKAIRQSGLDRSEVFISTKVLKSQGSVEASYDSILRSIERLAGVDGFVDMILIHNAAIGLEGRKELWLALEKLCRAGKTRSIGVSNHGIGHIQAMKEYATVWPPHANQLELHPWCQQKEIENYCRDQGILVEAYCPLVRNSKAQDPTLVAIASKYGVSTAQILVRWSLQKGWVPLPKSDNPSRIASNFDVYNFQLAEDDMASLNKLDLGADGCLVLAVSNE